MKRKLVRFKGELEEKGKHYQFTFIHQDLIKNETSDSWVRHTYPLL